MCWLFIFFLKMLISSIFSKLLLAYFIFLSYDLKSLIEPTQGFPVVSVVKNPPANAGDTGLISESGRSPWRRKQQPIPVFFLGKFHG